MITSSPSVSTQVSVVCGEPSGINVVMKHGFGPRSSSTKRSGRSMLMRLVRCSDPERCSAQTGCERFLAADFDPGSPLTARAEHGELARVTGQGEAWSGPTLFFGPSRRGDHDRCGDLFRHPAGSEA